MVAVIQGHHFVVFVQGVVAIQEVIITADNTEEIKTLTIDRGLQEFNFIRYENNKKNR